ncbi:DNA polymerase III subunit chi [Candidatus Ichthyocystis hellenicum]|uniref:DNA polymerase III subunit chi n=1 Tax=Candidatus Ichthyocystis hellenicum TaxID=1561003 RepID=UPI000B84FDB1|nr:DNA polymerase III subunit chi [Candidatus Ichthyocystis hellenicum]
MIEDTEVFFYFNSHRRLYSACRIVGDQYRKSPKQKILIFCESESSSLEMNQVLWQFQKITFIPHAIYGTDIAEQTPIVIVHQRTDVFEERAVVVNLLTSKKLCHWNKASRIIEIVSSNDEQEKRLARQRFRVYRNRCRNVSPVDLASKATLP